MKMMRSVFRSKETPPETAEDDALAKRFEGRVRLSWLALRPRLRLSPPTRQEALRRLERHAGIKHRPASSYEDRLGATPARETVALWSAHRERLSRLLARLKPSWPAPPPDPKDPS